MLISDIIRLSMRMFKINRSRTVLTILGISVGIGAILFLVSLGYGLQRLILDQIITSESLLSLDVSVGDVTNLKLDNNAIDDIQRIPGVEKISPLVSISTRMNIEDISSELTANFADSEYFCLEGTMLKKGNFYSDDEDNKNKIIISSSALRLFDLTEEECFDKKIHLTMFIPDQNDEKENLARNVVSLAENFEIIGIVEEENFNYIYLPFSISQDLNIYNFNKLKVKVISDDNMDIVRNSIIGQGYMVSALSDIIEQANQIFRVVQIVLALFGIVALIVSAIGMFNTMTIALLERTQEIGIMKSMGASNADIWSMFLGESVIIGFMGGVGGVIVGFVGGVLFNYGINFLAEMLGGSRIDLFWAPSWFIGLIIVFSTLIGLATGFYPAMRAAKISCLEALRYK